MKDKKFKRAKVHDLRMNNGTNPKEVCKCKDCKIIKNRRDKIFLPWYIRIFK